MFIFHTQQPSNLELLPKIETRLTSTKWFQSTVLRRTRFHCHNNFITAWNVIYWWNILYYTRSIVHNAQFVKIKIIAMIKTKSKAIAQVLIGDWTRMRFKSIRLDWFSHFKPLSKAHLITAIQYFSELLF